MSRYAVVDASNAPIVYVRVVAEPDDEGFSRYISDVGGAFRELDKFALIFNTGDLNRFPAKYREILNQWLVDTEAEFKGRWVSSAFVIKNRLIRGVLSAIYWMNRPYYEHCVVSSDEVAWEWTCSRLSAAGVALPNHVERASGL